MALMALGDRRALGGIEMLGKDGCPLAGGTMSDGWAALDDGGNDENGCPCPLDEDALSELSTTGTSSSLRFFAMLR